MVTSNKLLLLFFDPRFFVNAWSCVLPVFTTCKFASAIIFRPNCSKTLWSSFLVLSAKSADLHGFNNRQTRPSLYKPMFFLPNVFPRWFKMKRPTRWFKIQSNN